MPVTHWVNYKRITSTPLWIGNLRIYKPESQLVAFGAKRAICPEVTVCRSLESIHGRLALAPFSKSSESLYAGLHTMRTAKMIFIRVTFQLELTLKLISVKLKCQSWWSSHTWVLRASNVVPELEHDVPIWYLLRSMGFKVSFRRLNFFYSWCKRIRLKKLKQALGLSLQWPHTGPAAEGASKDREKTFHVQ